MDYALKRIWRISAGLIFEGKVEQRVGQRGAATEWRLRAELLQNQLFDRIVENSEAGADAQLPRTSGNLPQEAIAPGRRPSDADARSERFVIGGGETARHTLVSRENKPGGKHGIGGARRAAVRAAIICNQCGAGAVVRIQDARILRCNLAGTKRLQTVAGVVKRRVEFPAQAIVQSQIRLQLETVLREKCYGRVAVVFALGRAL